EAVETVGWRPDLAAARAGGASGLPTVLDVESVDRTRPWLYRFEERPARLRQSDDPELSERILSSVEQWAGDRTALRLPGGVVVDASIRNLLIDAIERW